MRHPVERRFDRALVVLDDGVAVRRLVAREPQRVQRERILVRRRPLLLDQAAEDADLDGVDVQKRTTGFEPATLSLGS
jgi:hypothetical protein